MTKKFKYPALVTKLTTICSGWIVGSAALDPFEVVDKPPRDYDIYIPMSQWRTASALIPKNATINRMGGFKCISEGIEVDVWTGDMHEFLSSAMFKAAYHPQTGIKIIREIKYFKK